MMLAKVLCNAIFKGMKGNDRKNAPGRQQSRRRIQGLFFSLQFAVDPYTQGLKRSRGRMDPAMPVRWGDRTRYYFSQGGRCPYGTSGSRRTDSFGNSPRISFFSVFENDIGKLFFPSSIDYIVCAFIQGRRKPHIKRLIMGKRKPPARVLEVVHGNTKIKKNEIGFPAPRIGQVFGEHFIKKSCIYSQPAGK
jgi:hypothetical protein